MTWDTIDAVRGVLLRGVLGITVSMTGCFPHLEMPKVGKTDDTADADTDTVDSGDTAAAIETGDSGDTGDTGTPPDTGTPVDTDTGETDSGGETGGDSGDTGTPDTDTPDTGAAHGVFAEFNFGDGGTCATAPWTDSSGGSIPSSMLFSDGAGTCGVHIYGGGSLTGPSGYLLYEGTGFIPGILYTVELSVVNTLETTTGVYADFSGGTVSSLSLAGSDSGTFTVSWIAGTAGAADLRVWTDGGSDFDVVLHGATISY